MQYIPFDDSYRAPYPQVSRAVQCDNLIFTSGQLDVDGEGKLQHEGDLRAETRRSMALLYDAIEQAGGTTADIAHLQVFYRNAGLVDTPAYRRELCNLLPPGCQPVIVMTPLETFAKGVQVEVDAIACLGASLRRVDYRGACVVRAGDWLCGSVDIDAALSDGCAELDAHEKCVGELGSAFDQVAKLRFYSSSLDSTIGKIERRVLDGFDVSRPVYTRLPLALSGTETPLAKLELFAVIARDTSLRRELSPGRLWPSPWGLSNPHAVQCGRYVFVGGQLALDEAGVLCDADCVEPQIGLVMAHVKKALAHFGLTLEHVVKVNAYHQGVESKSNWSRHVQQRADHYPSPGPASTGVEVVSLGCAGAMLTVECIAIAGDDVF